MSFGHFSYLLSGEQSQLNKVSSDKLELLANAAAKRYVEQGDSMNQTIAKMASENDLNTNQIERVCEMANIATHRALWSKTAQKEAIAFDLANAKTIIRVVKKQPLDASDPGGPQVSPTDESCETGPPIGPSSTHTHSMAPSADYAGPPTGIPRPGPSLMSMFGADPGQVHNGLHQDTPRKKIIIVLQKKANERQDLTDKAVYAGMELEHLEKKAYGALKQSVLGGETFYGLWKMAHAAGLTKAAAKYFPVWQQDLLDQADGLTRNRLEKIAIHKAPEELISDDLGGVVVINGAHPVLVSLDTVTKKTGEIKNLIHNLLRIDDEVKVYRQQLRELS